MDSAKAAAADHRPWWQQLNRYHWYVFALCAMGWLFDTMDQKIFTISRQKALEEFLRGETPGYMDEVGGWVTAIFMVGWATGGLIFGVLGDKYGRAKTMALTIMIYAFFTGFSALSQNWWQFAICRFLTGMGVGGEFAAGASLLAEVIPHGARTKTMGMLQALSALGNVMGAFLFRFTDNPEFGWRQLYWIGTAPALLAVFVRIGMKEPDRWVAAKAASVAGLARGDKDAAMGGLGMLFASPRWRHNALAGMSLAIAGVIGLWSIGFYMPKLIDTVIPSIDKDAKPYVEAVINEPDGAAQRKLAENMPPTARTQFAKLAASAQAPEVSADGTLSAPLSENSRNDLKAVFGKSKLISLADILQQIGAFFGMFCFAYLATAFGRRFAFLVAFVLAWAAAVWVVVMFKRHTDIYYMWPIMGFCMLLPFGGYAIYFPELFPTKLRSTGTSFCYNIGRYISASGPIFLGMLSRRLEGKTEMHNFRVAALIVSSCYLIGIVALIWAPETKDQPLPEDERGFGH